MKSFAFFIVALSLILHTGCSSKKVNESDPKEMYEDAVIGLII
jgi:hypothetical protein